MKINVGVNVPNCKLGRKLKRLLKKVRKNFNEIDFSCILEKVISEGAEMEIVDYDSKFMSDLLGEVKDDYNTNSEFIWRPSVNVHGQTHSSIVAKFLYEVVKFLLPKALLGSHENLRTMRNLVNKIVNRRYNEN